MPVTGGQEKFIGSSFFWRGSSFCKGCCMVCPCRHSATCPLFWLYRWLYLFSDFKRPQIPCPQPLHFILIYKLLQVSFSYLGVMDSLSISQSIYSLAYILMSLCLLSFKLIHKAKLLAWIYITIAFVAPPLGLLGGHPYSQEMDADSPSFHSLQATRLTIQGWWDGIKSNTKIKNNS